jgi:hypothetical protein
MRIVTWNCSRGSYFKKVARLDSLLWNVAVVQECATPPLESEHSLWFGDRVNQGIAVLSRPPYRLTRLTQIAYVPKFVIPVAVSAPGIEFVLFAVWSKKNKPYPYVQGVVKAVSMYRSVFDAGPCVIVGDFNSNTIWDKTHPSIANHSALYRTCRLSNCTIKSPDCDSTTVISKDRSDRPSSAVKASALTLQARGRD